MGNLLPGEPLIYTRSNGVVYARYRDPPHNKIPKWIIGGDPTAVAQAQGDLLSYSEWQKLCELSHEHLVLVMNTHTRSVGLVLSSLPSQ